MARISILMDNAEAEGLACEWGSAMALEDDTGGLWLWDTGASPKFLDNARALGLDFNRAQGLALSHGHYDHTGGIAPLLDAGFPAPSWPIPRSTARASPDTVGRSNPWASRFPCNVSNQ